MPFKTTIDPRTGKPATYSISGGGRVWLKDGKLLNPAEPVPRDVKKASDAVKTNLMKPFGKRKP